MLANPQILFADEPTSGLDSAYAMSVVSGFRELCQHHGRAIVCTIHQPSTQVFNQFDTLCLLAFGRVAYFGPRAAAIDYFAAQGFPCPPYSNPADYFIEVLSVPARATHVYGNV